jgi:hypothetical protein
MIGASNESDPQSQMKKDDIITNLLGLVTELVGLVSSGGAGNFLDLLALAVLPGSDTEQEAKDVALLLSPDLLKVLVGSHFLFISNILTGRL